jgi:OOP family OmpA-OmpF porin
MPSPRWPTRSGRLAVTAALIALVTAAGVGASDAADRPPLPAPRVVDLDPRIVDVPARIIDLGPIEDRGDETQVTVISDVLFAFDSAELSPAARDVLADVSGRLRQASGAVVVTGHTDSVGSDSYNLDLSRRRAQAVADFLRDQVSRSELGWQVEGKGDAEPVRPNTKPDGSDDPDGRRQNRRVVLTLPS